MFLADANGALRSADASSLLYLQYSIPIIRACIVTKFIRYVQTVRVSPYLLK
jgi:hypothetical protein